MRLCGCQVDVDVGVTAALVAAFGSLLVAIVAAVFTARAQTKVTTLKHDLDQQAKHQAVSWPRRLS